MGRKDLTVELVELLVAEQFPQWAGLAVSPVELDGWDNATFRLGPSMSVRLPSADAYSAQVDKEHRWLPQLAPRLPLPIPTPLGLGRPCPSFPRPWSVYGWIDGEPLRAGNVRDLDELATDLAGFLTALYACPPVGPSAGPHSFSRGGPVTAWDGQTWDLIGDLGGLIDQLGASAVWEAAAAAVSDSQDVWVHGDITGSNLLVSEGRLAGVIDFGCSAVGDPACDLTIAWTFFTGESRKLFRSLVPVEDSAWTRARGWALWKALLHVQAGSVPSASGWYPSDRRVGWRIDAVDIVAELVEDLRQEG